MGRVVGGFLGGGGESMVLFGEREGICFSFHQREGEKEGLGVFWGEGERGFGGVLEKILGDF